jgi:acyl-CoA synthetase (AMP-forming)/AMP-acid ligase II
MMLTFADPLLRAERCFAQREALVDGDVRLTFGELVLRCRQVAGAVSAAAEPGDRIALLAANRHETLELHLGVPVAGCAIVPLNTRLADAELAYVLEDCQPRVLVTDRSPEDVAELASRVERVVHLDGLGDGDDYEDWIGGANALDLASSPAAPDALAGLFYTGGTTGRAKGVMLTHANRTADTLHLGLCVRVSGDDAWLVLGPMHHASGIFQALLCVWQGARQILIPAFDPAVVLDLIERERATVTFGVPLMLTQLAEAQAGHPRDVTSLRLIGYGAAPATTVLLEQFHAAFPHTELVSMYGATELAPMGTCLEHMERHLHGELALSAGRPVPGVGTAGITRAISATSTTRAASSWSTGRRT